MRSNVQYLRLPFATRRSPITLLPVELIEVIFGYYAQSPEVSPNTNMEALLGRGVGTFSSQTDDMVHPMIPTQVSKLGRQISLSLPLLLSRIYISHPTKEHVKLAASG
ncbi:hypothetical protein GALMADRAFT_252490 [Galerina marginata CBS 339.88]|uniref:F-box domain-containing protein n=1 Tax=Galerina marginata (strain CBS 339.88) TaxID=685588 RepID=A0A067T222_GALM3|nr:hypothetical protein GALMADRAFT_252490 [Galerina marginata CBS 339.88]